LLWAQQQEQQRMKQQNVMWPVPNSYSNSDMSFRQYVQVKCKSSITCVTFAHPLRYLYIHSDICTSTQIFAHPLRYLYIHSDICTSTQIFAHPLRYLHIHSDISIVGFLSSWRCLVPAAFKFFSAVDLRQMDCEGVGCCQLAQEREDIVKTVMSSIIIGIRCPAE